MWTTIYAIVMTSERAFFATGGGLMETDRAMTRPLSRFAAAPESMAVDQFGVLGGYLIYRNFDREETVAAIDLETGAHAVLGSSATVGPYVANGHALWIERDGQGGIRAVLAALDE